jgi:Flp pilus assembly protein TadG
MRKLSTVGTKVGWCVRLIPDEGGSGLVEFALSSTILLMIIFGILDFSRVLYADHFMAYAAREATRYAMVRGSSWNGVTCTSPSTFSCTATGTDITNFVKSITPIGVASSKLTVTSTWTGNRASGVACNAGGPANIPGCVVKIKIGYTFSFAVPFKHFTASMPSSFALSSTSSVGIAQ